MKFTHTTFVPVGEINDVQIPLDYETEKHRGFAFIEFELAEDAAAAIDNMNDGELFGRTIRVNAAKPMSIKEGSSRYYAHRLPFYNHVNELIDSTI